VAWLGIRRLELKILVVIIIREHINIKIPGGASDGAPLVFVGGGGG
jgi:hypothetical protein